MKRTKTINEISEQYRRLSAACSDNSRQKILQNIHERYIWTIWEKRRKASEWGMTDRLCAIRVTRRIYAGY